MLANELTTQVYWNVNAITSQLRYAPCLDVGYGLFGGVFFQGDLQAKWEKTVLLLILSNFFYFPDWFCFLFLLFKLSKFTGKL